MNMENNDIRGLDVINITRNPKSDMHLNLSKKCFQLLLKHVKINTGFNLMKPIKKIDRKIGIKTITGAGKVLILNIALISSLVNTKLVHADESTIISETSPDNNIIEEDNSIIIENDVKFVQNVIDEVQDYNVTFVSELEDYAEDWDLEVNEFTEEFYNSQIQNECIEIEGKQAGISSNNTPYDLYYDRWSKNTRQRNVADEWDSKGRQSDRGIATIDGRYLVAMTTMFGLTGDNVDVVLRDGTVIPCKIADAKSYNDEMSSPYGHMLQLSSGEYGVDVIEWEIVGNKEDMDIDDWRGQGVDYVITYTDAKVKTYE